MRMLVVVLLIALASMCAAEEKDSFADWYGMLEFQLGLTYDPDTGESREFAMAPVVGWKDVRLVIGTEASELEPTAWLAGLTYNIGDLQGMGVDIPWMEHFGFNIGVCAAYDLDSEDVGWRCTVSIIDLSFDEGNAERHKNR